MQTMALFLQKRTCGKMSFRRADLDVRKSKADRKRIIEQQKCCSLSDCNELLTFFKGPGNDLYCREHQIEQIQYGGFGRQGKEHTFHRTNVCDCCGNDITVDPRQEACRKRYGSVDEKQFHEINRRYMHGDHVERKADGGADTSDNVDSLCSYCHWYKTVVMNDGVSSKVLDTKA